MRETRTFVTGATGLLGRRVVRGLLGRGEAVTALVRGDGEERARARLLRALGDVPTERLAVVPGCVERLPEARALLAPGPVLRVLHMAALLDLGETRHAELRAVNVGGTRAVLRFTAACGATEFHHVSTAYVWGAAAAPHSETAPRGRIPHRNEYERTKLAAERLVRRAARRTGRRTTILRPGILVGDSRSGRVDVHGAFYDVLRLLSAASEAGAVTLPADPASPLGLVPVDRVAEAVLRLVRSPAPGVSTWNLTNPAPPRVADLVEAARRVLGTELRCGDGAAARLARLVRPFLPYLRDGSRFEQERTARALGAGFLLPRVPTATWVERLIRTAAEGGFGVPPEALARERARILRLLGAARPVPITAA